MAWNQRPDMVDKFRLAIGSFVEEYSNKVQVDCNTDTKDHSLVKCRCDWYYRLKETPS